jgi:Ribbon-helix-helix protein
MERKTARLTILVDPAKKKAFEGLCAVLDVTPSQVVRQLIREYLAAHGVGYRTQSTRGRGSRRRRAASGARVHR